MDDELVNNSIWVRYLLVAALLSGTGGSVMGVVQGNGTYSAKDAERDFAIRDERTRVYGSHEERIRELEEWITIHQYDRRAHGGE